MHRLSKVILVSFISILVMVGVAILGFRAYLQGDGGRERIEKALGKALKLPLRVRTVSWEFPATLRAEGITTDGDLKAGGQPSLSAAFVHGTLALRPLLSGRLEIGGVELHQPGLSWSQNEEGEWVWPQPEEVHTEKVSEPTEKGETKSRVYIRDIKVSGGTVEMKNSQGGQLIVANDVTTHFSEINDVQLIGVVTAGRLVWAGSYTLEDVRTNLRYARDIVELQPIDAKMYGGTIHGRYEMDTRSEGQPFKAEIKLGGVDLALVGTAAGWADGDLSGKLTGEAQLSGRSDQVARLEGPGRISIVDGRFTRLGVFGSLASLLGITELTDLRTREAAAEFDLRDEKVFIHPLVLATENLRLTATGEARFDTKLKLDAQLQLSDRFVQTLPEIARGSFTRGDDGRMALDFKITGNTTSPKTDLAERLIGGKVQDKIGDLLGSLFGSKPQKKDKEEKKEDGAKSKRDDQSKERQ